MNLDLTDSPLPPQCWDYSRVIPTCLLYGFWAHEFQSSCLYGKSFIRWTISWLSFSPFSKSLSYNFFSTKKPRWSLGTEIKMASLCSNSETQQPRKRPTVHSLLLTFSASNVPPLLHTPQSLLLPLNTPSNFSPCPTPPTLYPAGSCASFRSQLRPPQRGLRLTPCLKSCVPSPHNPFPVSHLHSIHHYLNLSPSFKLVFTYVPFK